MAKILSTKERVACIHCRKLYGVIELWSSNGGTNTHAEYEKTQMIVEATSYCNWYLYPNSSLIACPDCKKKPLPAYLVGSKHAHAPKLKEADVRATERRSVASPLVSVRKFDFSQE